MNSEVQPIEKPEDGALTDAPAAETATRDSYVKLAMRNMVKKRGTSLLHFMLTTLGLVALLVGLAVLLP